MTPDDRPAAVLFLLLWMAMTVSVYWLAATIAAIYRERPVVYKDEDGKYHVMRDVRRR